MVLAGGMGGGPFHLLRDNLVQVYILQKGVEVREAIQLLEDNRLEKMTVPIEKNENDRYSALRSISENLGVTTIIDLLRKSSWALDQPFKTIEISDKQAYSKH